ncbi:flavoprotein-like protein [Gorgonomyces haynaldii]|nr:flavoprotein-like protein [Gorgonomyces haynaldii]
MPKVFVIIYSAWGHVLDLAKEQVKGLKDAGVDAELYQVPETLPAEVTAKMHIQKFDVPVLNVADLPKADGFLFGIPTRYGVAPAQVKAFWDATGQLWATGALHGKFAGIFTSTSTQHGGIETTAFTFLPNLVHHGINFVPFGYKNKGVGNATEIHGASPWGAGTVNSQSEGKTAVSELERSLAFAQGKDFGTLIKKVAN